MKQPTKKKLSLDTQTIRTLRTDELDVIAGAGSIAYQSVLVCPTRYFNCTVPTLICP